MERRQEAGFLSPISSKITQTKEKGMSKRKSEEVERSRREKSMVALLVFTMATLEIVFGRKKKLLDTKSPIGGNVFRNPPRLYNLVLVIVGLKWQKTLFTSQALG